ncbi:MAG: hypothetical protein EZS28_034612, partial [Streblomastix strix]
MNKMLIFDRHIAVKNAQIEADKIIAALKHSPGKVTKIARDFCVTTTRAYTIAYSYYIDQQYCIGKQSRYSSYVSQISLDRIANDINARVAKRESLSFADISTVTGTQLKLQPLVLKFSYRSLFQVYTSEIIKDVRARGISNMDEIGLCGWRTKVD